VDGPIGSWLVSDVVLLGVHVQPWMLVLLGIAALGILTTWLTGGFDNSR
jgi:hypothetical protein